MVTKYLFLSILLFSVLIFSQKQNEAEWKVLGLSQGEWDKCIANDITMKKLKYLLSRGITVSEYLSKPWITLGISERSWIKQREKGLNTEDIQAFKESGDQSGWIILSGIVPGYRQLRRKDYPKFGIMSGVAVGSLLLYQFNQKAVLENTIIVKKPNSMYLIVFGVDVIASLIDVYRNDFPKSEFGPGSQSGATFDIEKDGNGAKINYSFLF